MEFSKFGFDDAVLRGIRAAGYTAPTPIQAQAIPLVCTGEDIIGLAQTGTGKTAAFILPILQRLLTTPKKKVRALVLAPTRELAAQIDDTAKTLSRGTGIMSTAVFGGVSFNRQVETLRGGIEILIACPGRLLDHLAQKTVDLSGVDVLVLDEADQMFDMGFLPDIRRILKQLPAQRQTLLFSATMPEEIRSLAKQVLRNPKTVQVGRTEPAQTVAQALYPVPQHLKTPLLLQLIGDIKGDSILIFTRTKHRAKRLGEQLEKAGHAAASLQGNLSQNRRQEAMDGFRSGAFRILAATDIAARGIDVSRVSHVINYDVPETAETYVHRIGRTGRAARSGEAFTFVTEDDAATLRAIERLLGKPLERRKVGGFDYAAPAPEKTDAGRPARSGRPAVRPAAPAAQRAKGEQRHQQRRMR